MHKTLHRDTCSGTRNIMGSHNLNMKGLMSNGSDTRLPDLTTLNRIWFSESCYMREWHRVGNHLPPPIIPWQWRLRRIMHVTMRAMADAGTLVQLHGTRVLTVHSQWRGVGIITTPSTAAPRFEASSWVLSGETFSSRCGCSGVSYISLLLLCRNRAKICLPSKMCPNLSLLWLQLGYRVLTRYSWGEDLRDPGLSDAGRNKDPGGWSLAVEDKLIEPSWTPSHIILTRLKHTKQYSILEKIALRGHRYRTLPGAWNPQDGTVNCFNMKGIELHRQLRSISCRLHISILVTIRLSGRDSCLKKRPRCTDINGTLVTRSKAGLRAATRRFIRQLYCFPLFLSSLS